MLHAMLVLILEYSAVVAVEPVPVSFPKESSAYSEQYEPTQSVHNLMLMCNSSCNVLDHPML